MPILPSVASLWIGPKLEALEQLCLKSFVDAGHPVTLYTYDDVDGVPDGITVKDASSILSGDDIAVNANFNSPGPHADRFRYRMLAETDHIWVDSDAYCRKAFPDIPYVFASHHKTLLANGVLRLPKESPALARLIEFTADPYPVLPSDFYWKERLNVEHQRQVADHGARHIGEMRWETWGPDALTYFLNQTGEDRHALERHMLYPLTGSEAKRTLLRPGRAQISLPEDCISIHFYGSNFRRYLKLRGGYHPRSLFARLCDEHGIPHPTNPEIDQ